MNHAVFQGIQCFLLILGLLPHGFSSAWVTWRRLLRWFCWMVDWKGCVRNLSCPVIRYCTSTCIEGLKKTMKHLTEMKTWVLPSTNQAL